MGKSMSTFLDRLIRAFPTDYKNLSPDEQKEFADAHWNHLFDLKGPRSIKRKRLPIELWYHRRLFVPFGAIHKSYEALQDIEIYFRRFPYSGTRVSPVNHLRHNIYVYLEEVYILRQRLIDYLNILEKDYADDPQGKQIKGINQPLCQMLKKHIQPMIAARKIHVHEGGYDEDALIRLDSLELLANYKLQNDAEDKRWPTYLYKQEYKVGYKQERKRWSKLVRNWNVTIEKLADAYFKSIGPIIFIPTGELVFPSSAKNYSPS